MIARQITESFKRRAARRLVGLHRPDVALRNIVILADVEQVAVRHDSVAVERARIQHYSHRLSRCRSRNSDTVAVAYDAVTNRAVRLPGHLVDCANLQRHSSFKRRAVYATLHRNIRKLHTAFSAGRRTESMTKTSCKNAARFFHRTRENRCRLTSHSQRHHRQEYHLDIRRQKKLTGVKTLLKHDRKTALGSKSYAVHAVSAHAAFPHQPQN